MEGNCLCGKIALKINDDNLFGSQRRGHICHCANCRKVAGGIFGTNLMIETDKVEWIKGKDFIKKYSDPDTLSGTPVARYFCPECGVPIMSVTPLYEGKTILKLGIYPVLPVPEWESFCEKRQKWESPLPGTVQYKIKSFGEKVEGSPETASAV